MKRFQSIIQNYITNHQRHKKYLAAVLALSILVSFGVSAGLIMPAVSMTNNDNNTSGNIMQLRSTEAGVDYITEDDTARSTKTGFNFETTLTAIKSGTSSSVSVEGYDEDTWSGRLTLNYTLSHTQLISAGDDNRYIYCQLDNNIRVLEDAYGPDKIVFDGSSSWANYCKNNNLSDDTKAGYYSVNTNGLVTIKFTEAYVEYLDWIEHNEANVNPIKYANGSVGLDGEIGRANSASGDQTITMNNGNVKFTVEFPDRSTSVNKEAVNIEYPNNELPIVSWKITIDNPYGTFDLNGYTVTDNMLSRKIGEPTIKPDDVGEVNGNTFTVNQECKQSVTIEYKTRVTEKEIKEGKIENNAVLKDSDGNTINESPDRRNLNPDDLKATVSKTGRPSYMIDAAATVDYIEWTINISRKYGLSLDGCTVTDAKFASAMGGKIYVDGAEVNISNNTTYVFGSGSGSSATITYRTPVNIDNPYNNSVTVTPPGVSSTPVDAPEVNWVNDYYGITKSQGSVPQNADTVTWQVEIWCNGGGRLGDLKDYKIQDPDFAKDGLTYELIEAKNTADQWADPNAVKHHIAGDELIIDAAPGVARVKFKYTRPLTPQEKANRRDGEETSDDTISNTAKVIPPGDKPVIPSTDTVHMPPLNDNIVKSLDNHSSSDSDIGDPDNLENASANEEKKIELPWYVEIHDYDGFDNGTAFVDAIKTKKLSKESSDGTETETEIDGRHTMSQEQFDAITIESAKELDGTSVSLTKDEDYTVTKTEKNGKIVGFSISFTGDNVKKCVSLKIKYATTANVTDLSNAGEKNKFYNESNFGNLKDDADFTFERENPTNVPNNRLTLNKRWQNASTSSKPTNIRVQIYRSTDPNSTDPDKWKTYGNIETIGNSGKTWELPAYTADKNRTPYYYKVVEVNSNNEEIGSNGTITFEGKGSYTVTYGEPVRLDSDKNFTITNTRTDMDLTVKKVWASDEPDNTSKRGAVKVQLQYFDTADNQWKRVDRPDADATLAYDSTNKSNVPKTWSNLPRFDGSNPIRYRVEEINSGTVSENYVVSYSNTDGINSSGEITITNTYKFIKIHAEKKWVGESNESISAPEGTNITFELQKKVANGYGEAQNKGEIKKSISNNAANYSFELPADVKAEDKLIFSVSNAANSSGCLAWHDADGSVKTVDWTADNSNPFTKEFSVPSGFSSRDFEFQILSNFQDNSTVSYQVQKKLYKNVDYDWKTVATETGPSLDKEWDNLPVYGENGIQYVYRVVEKSCPSDYKVEYSKSEISSNEDNLIITNRKRAKAEKRAVKPAETVGNANGVSSDDVVPITSITTDDLRTWPTRKINGQTYYIFKWFVSLNNTVKYDYIEDLLPENAIFYNDTQWSADGDGFGFVVFQNNLGNDFKVEWAVNNFNEWQSTSNHFAFKEKSNNKFILDLSKKGDVYYNGFTYCTAVPKSIVDDAVSEKGFYNVTNKIRTDSRDEFTETSLEIKKSVESADTTGLLEKNEMDTEISHLKGEPKYQLVINPEGKDLVTGDRIDITDMFEVLGYKSPTGDRVNCTLESQLIDVALNNIRIKELDKDGRFVRYLDATEYSSLVSTGVVTQSKATEYTDKVADSMNKKRLYISEKNVKGSEQIEYKVVKMEVPIVYTGSGTFRLVIENGRPNEPLNITIINGYGSDITLTTDNPLYDAEGKATVEFSCSSSSEGNAVYSSLYIENCIVQDRLSGVSPTTFVIDSSSAVNFNGSYQQKSVTEEHKTKVAYLLMSADNALPAGLEFIVKATNGKPGSPVVAEPLVKTDDFIVEEIDSVYDANGDAQIKITMLNEAVCKIKTRNHKDEGYNDYSLVSSKIVEVTDKVKTTLKLNVPDETPLVVEYDYSLKTNENTPDISNENRGKTPPEGATIFMKNEASFKTSDGEAWDETEERSFIITSTDAYIQATEYPTIQKVDVGNYSIKLEATFALAKYENGKWVYAKKFSDEEGSGCNTPTFGIDETTDGKVPDDIAQLAVPKTGYNIQLDPDVKLYKLVEIEAPKEGSYVNNYTEGSPVNGKYPYVFYFTYNHALSAEDLNTITNSMLEDKKITSDDIINLKVNGDIQIPNSKNFGLEVEKVWDDGIRAYKRAEVEVELVWSHLKSSSIPDDAQPILRGLGYTGDAAQTITTTINGDEITSDKKSWTELPSGIDGKAVYYYAKEKSYKLYTNDTDYVEYTLDVSDGVFKGANGEAAPFNPLYTGNGLNKGGTITVKNVSKLVIKKLWKDGDGNIIDVDNESIDYQLKAVKNGELVTLVNRGTLTKEDGWQAEVNEVLIGDENMPLSQYTRFEIIELVDGQEMDNYNISTNYDIKYSSGEIILINKDKRPASVDVTANKVWSDGNKLHETGSATVKLVRSKGILSSKDLKEYSVGSLKALPAYIQLVDKDKNGDDIDNVVTLSAENEWSYKWENLPYTDTDGKTEWHYYVIETAYDSGTEDNQTYEVSYGNNGNAAKPLFTIRNNRPGAFKIEKKWLDESEMEMSSNYPVSEIPITLYYKEVDSDYNLDNDEKDANGLPTDLFTSPEYKVYPLDADESKIDQINGWSLDLSTLPKGPTGNSDKKYLYYVVENADADLWNITYTNNGQPSDEGQPIEITNAKKSKMKSISIIKKWVDDGYNRPETISFQLQRKRQNEGNGSWENFEGGTLSEPIKNDNEWRYTYSNLPAGSDKNPYVYRIVEAEVEGYAVTYENGGEAKSNVIRFTNTNTVKLQLNKEWVGDDSYSKDIEIKIKRSTTEPLDSNINLMMSITGNSYMQVGKESQQLSVNRAGEVTYSSDNSTIAAVTPDGIVTPLKEGTVTITAVCGEEKATLQIQVSPEPFVVISIPENEDMRLYKNVNDKKEVQLIAGMSDKSGADYTYKYEFAESTDIATITEGGILTLLGAGTVKIKATAYDSYGEVVLNSKSAPVTGEISLDIKYPEFAKNAFGESTIEIQAGREEAITNFVNEPDEWGNFEYSIEGSSNVTITNDGTISTKNANVGDTATIKVSRDGCEAEFNVSITAAENPKQMSSDSEPCTVKIPADHQNNIKHIELVFDETSSGQIDLFVNEETSRRSWFQFDYHGYVENCTWIDSTTVSVNLSISKLEKLVFKKGSGWATFNAKLKELKIYHTDGTPAYTCKDFSEPAPALFAMFSLGGIGGNQYSIESAEPYAVNSRNANVTFTKVDAGTEVAVVNLTQTGGWQATIENLPAYDEKGKPYYYWAEEVTVPGFEVSYRFDDSDINTISCINASKLIGHQGSITIRNTKVESEGVTMPSTGGTGTTWYYITGMALMLMPVVILVRRRKKST